MIMEISRVFDQIYKEHLDGVYVLHFVFFHNYFVLIGCFSFIIMQNASAWLVLVLPLRSKSILLV